MDSIFAPSPSARSARETAATKQRCAACGKRLMLTSYMLLAARPALATVADDVAADLAATSLANPGTSWALLNRTREVSRSNSLLTTCLACARTEPVLR